jgi:hypothetical protein
LFGHIHLLEEGRAYRVGRDRQEGQAFRREGGETAAGRDEEREGPLDRWAAVSHPGVEQGATAMDKILAFLAESLLPRLAGRAIPGADKGVALALLFLRSILDDRQIDEGEKAELRVAARAFLRELGEEI